MNNTIHKCMLLRYEEYKTKLLGNPERDFSEMFDYIENRGFTELPASLNYHLKEQGGLLAHSVHVATELEHLTKQLGLTWERPESPIIVGLFHDLCKLEFYKSEVSYDPRGGDKLTFVHNDTPEFNLGGHGMLSVVLAQRFIKLTDEEIHCIRFHMGAYETKDWSMYDAAIRKYPNVLYTHTADMIASKILEG